MSENHIWTIFIESNDAIKIWCTITSKYYALFQLSLTVHQVSSTSFNENCKKSYPETKLRLKTL